MTAKGKLGRFYYSRYFPSAIRRPDRPFHREVSLIPEGGLVLAPFD